MIQLDWIAVCRISHPSSCTSFFYQYIFVSFPIKNKNKKLNVNKNQSNQRHLWRWLIFLQFLNLLEQRLNPYTCWLYGFCIAINSLNRYFTIIFLPSLPMLCLVFLILWHCQLIKSLIHTDMLIRLHCT